MVSTSLLLAGILLAGSRATRRLPCSSGAGGLALAWIAGSAIFVLQLNLLAASMPLGAAQAPSLALTFLIAEALSRLGPACPRIPPPPVREKRRVKIVLFLVTSVTGLAALRGYFFDEIDHHLALALEIGRGLFPPPFPFLPGAPFNYHYGVDLMAAAIESQGAVPIWYAFDILTILSCFSLIAMLAEIAWIGREPGLAPWASLLGVMGSGLAWTAFPRDLAALPAVDLPGVMALPFQHLGYTGWEIPPVISYLHQHPMAFGAPYYLALLYTYLRVREAGELVRLVLIVPFFTALSICQITLFYLTFPLLVVSEIARIVLTRFGGPDVAGDPASPPPPVEGRVLAVAAAMVASALLAALSSTIGGAPTPSGDTVRVTISIPPWHVTGFPFPGYLAVFGIPLLVWFAVLPKLLAQRHFPLVVLGIGGFGGFLVPHLFVFLGSPYDTVKFFFPTMLAANLTLAWVVARCLGGKRPRPLLGLALAAASVPSALCFLYVRSLGPLGIAEGLKPIPDVLFPGPAGQAMLPLAAILRQESHPADVVLTRSDFPSIHSGVPSFSPREPRHDFPDAWEVLDPDHRYKEEQRLMFETLDPERLRRHRIRWLVLGPGAEGELGPAARAILDARPELLRHRVGEWSLHDLAPLVAE